MDKISEIKKYHIFKNIDEKDIMALMRCFGARIINVQKGNTFITTRSKIDYLYIILSGTAKDVSFNKDGKENSYAEFSDGDIIGLLRFSQGKKTFPYDVVALTDLKLLAVSAFRFLNPCQNYCPRHTKVLQNVIVQFGKQTFKIDNHLKDATKKTTREKILSYLNKVSSQKKTKEFDIPYTHQELANYLGVERSALSFELSKLKKEKVLSYNRKHYILY